MASLIHVNCLDRPLVVGAPMGNFVAVLIVNDAGQRETVPDEVGH